MTNTFNLRAMFENSFVCRGQASIVHARFNEMFVFTRMALVDFRNNLVSKPQLRILEKCLLATLMFLTAVICSSAIHFQNMKPPCQYGRRPGTNFINILSMPIAAIFLCQKITKPNASREKLLNSLSYKNVRIKC